MQTLDIANLNTHMSRNHIPGYVLGGKYFEAISGLPLAGLQGWRTLITIPVPVSEYDLLSS